MTRDAYLKQLRDLLSGDHERVRRANQVLYAELVGGEDQKQESVRREADLTLAAVPNP
jgi:hypothetical protein